MFDIQYVTLFLGQLTYLQSMQFMQWYFKNSYYNYYVSALIEESCCFHKKLLSDNFRQVAEGQRDRAVAAGTLVTDTEKWCNAKWESVKNHHKQTLTFTDWKSLQDICFATLQAPALNKTIGWSLWGSTKSKTKRNYRLQQIGILQGDCICLAGVLFCPLFWINTWIYCQINVMHAHLLILFNQYQN